MSFRLQELQEFDSKTQELGQQKVDGYKKINEILYHRAYRSYSKPFKQNWLVVITKIS